MTDLYGHVRIDIVTRHNLIPSTHCITTLSIHHVHTISLYIAARSYSISWRRSTSAPLSVRTIIIDPDTPALLGLLLTIRILRIHTFITWYVSYILAGTQAFKIHQAAR